MVRFSEEKLKSVYGFLESMKVFTLDQVSTSLGCSTPTARLKLKTWQAYTSYNQNGRYYTMPKVPRFDEKGLWHYDAVSFSRYGNLKKTVVHLVNISASGLTGKEIGDLVRLPARSFLHHFRDAAGMRREKTEGRYVYFSEDPGKYEAQLRNRSTRAVAAAGKGLSDADAVVVLAALIKHRGICVDDIMQLPEVRERGLSAVVIGEFLDRHGLLKKTPITKR